MTDVIKERIAVLGAGIVATLLVFAIAVAPASALSGSNTVGSGDIINGQVKMDDIGDNAVGAKELGANSVGNSAVVDNSLSAASLATGSVASDELAAGAVATADVADDAVTGAKLANDITLAGVLGLTVQAVTVADNGGGTAAAGTVTPTTSYVEATCSDADGCDMTLSETGAAEGDLLTVVNVSANVANFADTAGVSETGGALAAGQYDNIQYVYIGDRWVETGRTNN